MITRETTHKIDREGNPVYVITIFNEDGDEIDEKEFYGMGNAIAWIRDNYKEAL